MQDRASDDDEESTMWNIASLTHAKTHFLSQISLAETRQNAPPSSISVSGEATRAEPAGPIAPSTVGTISAQASHRHAKTRLEP